MSDSTTTNTAGAVTDTMETAKEVAGKATERAGEVAGEAKAQAVEVARQAKDQLRELMDRAREDVSSEARARSQQTAGSLRTLADQFGALVQGNPQGAGPLADLLREGQARLSTLAGRLDDGPEAALADVRRCARRQPVLFLAAAGGLGFLAGRLMRAGRQAAQSGGSSAGLVATSRTATLPPVDMPPPGGPDVLVPPVTAAAEGAPATESPVTPGTAGALGGPLLDPPATPGVAP